MLSRSSILLQSVVNHYERLGLKLAMPKGLEGGAGSSSSAATSEGATASATTTTAAIDVYRYADFTEAQIKAAYRRKALECHPDVAVGHEKTAAEANFRRISESFAALQDASKRKAIDEELQQVFTEAIVRKHGGRVVYRSTTRQGEHVKAGAEGKSGPYAHPAMKEAFERRKAYEAKMSARTAPFTMKGHGGSSASQPSSTWRDTTNDKIYSTNPVGAGIPSYEHYLKGVEIEEGQSVSSMTSTWVKSTERLGSSASSSSAKSSSSARRRSNTSTSSSSSVKAAPFLRKDADKAFKDAFDGKSWNEVLFQMRYQSRYGTNTGAGDTTPTGGEGADKASPAASSSTADASSDKAFSSTSTGTTRDYKLQSPLLRNAKAMSADDTAASILNNRYDRFVQQGRVGGSFSGGVAGNKSMFGHLPGTYSTVTSTDGTVPRQTTSGSASNLRHTTFAEKVTQYANGPYFRHERDADNATTGAVDEEGMPKPMASGGTTHFPHIAPSQSVEGVLTEALIKEKGYALVHSKKQRLRMAAARAKAAKEARMLKRMRSRATTEMKQSMGVRDGKLYSYHRPY